MTTENETNQDTENKPESGSASGAATCSVPYEPVRIAIDETLLLDTLDVLKDSLTYIEEERVNHEATLGRTTRKNQAYAAVIENDMRRAKRSIAELSKILLPNAQCPPAQTR